MQHRIRIERPTMLFKGNHVYVACTCGEDVIFSNITPDDPKVKAWVSNHLNNNK